MDVYDDSPTIVTTWLTIMPKISILIILVEILIGLDLKLAVYDFSPLNLSYESLSAAFYNGVSDLQAVSVPYENSNSTLVQTASGIANKLSEPTNLLSNLLLNEKAHIERQRYQLSSLK